MWISKNILEWNSDTFGFFMLDTTDLERSYKILDHAQKRLNEAKNDFDLIDVITTIKRSINKRMKLLNRIYRFKKIPIDNKPKKLLELLELFNIIRPLMLIKMIGIRNKI